MEEKELMQEDIVKTALQEAEKAEGSRALYEVKMKFLGRAGVVTAMLKKMRELSPEERPSFGKRVNAIRERLEQDFAAVEARLKERELAQKLESESLDVTMPGKRQQKGALHPVTRVKNELVDIFAGMGFEIFEGPEIENDYYNFTALNTPADHPARICHHIRRLPNRGAHRRRTGARLSVSRTLLGTGEGICHHRRIGDPAQRGRLSRFAE